MLFLYFQEQTLELLKIYNFKFVDIEGLNSVLRGEEANMVRQ